MKTCSKCKKEKPTASYYSNKRNKDGLVSYCKECHQEQKRNYLSDPANAEKVKATKKKYRIENINKKRETDRLWRSKNPEKQAASRRRQNERIQLWRKNNRDHLLELGKQWREKHVKKRIDGLHNQYIKQLICQKSKITAKDIPAEFIETKRLHLLIHRELRKQP